MRHFTPRRLSVAVVVAIAGLGTLAACGSDEPTAVDPAPAANSSTPTPTPAPTPVVPTQTPVTESPAPSPTESEDATESMITLATPADGDVVSGSFAVEGMANSPEANVPWTLVNTAGEVVAEGAFTAEGWMDKLYPFSSSVGLTNAAPGEYTFTVAIDDPSDGEGKPADKVAVSLTVE